MNRKRVFRRTGTGRRFLSFLFAFVWLFYASGINAFAENNIIYSEPVTAPIRTVATSQPVEAEVDPLKLPEADETPEEGDILPDEKTEENGTEPDVEESAPDETGEHPEDDAGKDETEVPEETVEAAEPMEEQEGNQPVSDPEEQEANQPVRDPEERPAGDNADGEAEGAPEAKPETERIWYAGSLTAETEGCTVRINYPAEACIDENANLFMETAKGMELYTALKSAAKVIRNEENETWRQQVSEDGNLFYLLKLTDSEGNEILPAAGVNLICEQLNIPDDVTCFLAGGNARILEVQDGILCVSDYRMEPFGYATVDRIQTGTVTQEFQAADYLVTAAYGPEAGFPSDTEMKVREIRPDTPEYALYSGMTEETLGEDWSEITLERYFDITFVSGGKEVEPQAEVDVQIIFKDVIELTEEHDVQAVHIENNEAKVIESETDSNDDAARQNGEVIDTVSFTSDSFSVFGVVQRTKITQKVLAADGNTYEINVGYGQEAEIPEGAELLVEEIPEGSSRWEAYRKLTAEALDADDVQLPGLYDISIVHEGQKIEPREPVNVSIRLANAEAGKDLHVIHFTDDIPEELPGKEDAENNLLPQETERKAATEMVAGAVTDGDTVTFEADSFSVYAFAYPVTVYYRTASGETYQITLDFDENSGIPAGSVLQVEEILPGEDRYEEYLGKALNRMTGTAEEGDPEEETAETEIPEDLYARFFDIEIRKDGQKIEPVGNVTVALALADLPEDRLAELTVIHFTGEDLDILSADVNADTGILFMTDSFSVYGVITEPNGQSTDNLDGKAVRINVATGGKTYYLTSEQIVATSSQPAKLSHSENAADAALWQFEAAEGSNQYNIFTYINGAKRYMNITAYSGNMNNLILSDTPQALTASRLNNGRFVIYTRINNANCYVDLWEGGNGLGFAAYRASNPNNNQQLRFDFSTPAGEQYAVVVHYNDAYYVVEEDGSLTPANYNPEAKAVEMENPVLWDYQSGGQSNTLSSVTDGKTFNGPGGTADFFYYKYIDPAADSGIYTEDATHSSGAAESGFVFENNRMRSTSNTSKYLGVEVDSSGTPIKISGNANSGNAVEVLLAKIIDTFVPSDKPANNTVNHLDISIHGNAELIYPLPRGTYYDANGNVLFTVDRDHPKSITMREAVPVTREDIISAEIIAKDKNGNELDNAFYVTGYTGNEGDHNPDMPTQIRIEGSFRVSDHVSTSYPDMTGDEDANWSWLQNNSEHTAIRADRLNNEITYYVSKTKPVTFTLKDGDQILYDADGNPMTLEVPVTMAGNCSYWSGKNTCPGIDYNGGRGTNGPWACGCIVGSGADATGIDFILGGSTTQAADAYPTVDITKYIVDENNEPITTQESSQNLFTVYQLENTGLSSECNQDYSAYTRETELTVQVAGGVGKNYYDLNVPAAMIYIEEDKDSIPQTILVKGNEWKYEKTVIETEYARRWPSSAAQTAENHRTDDLTAADEHYNSVPELAGKYKVGNDDYDNTILNFYVYNVYKAETTAEVTKEWSDNAEHYDSDSVQIRLLRYSKGAPPVEMGTLNISHAAAGLQNLPAGFTVTYSYSGAGDSASGLSAGSYEVPAGNYTVTAHVTNPAAPEGYLYQSTNGPLSVAVPGNGTGTAAFVSTYVEDRPETGYLNITHTSSGLSGTALPPGFAVTYSYSGTGGSASGLSAGSYEVPAGIYTVTATVTNSAAPSGYQYVSTNSPLSVSVPTDGTGTAAFVSTYAMQSSGSTWKIQQYYNGSTAYSGNINYPVGTRVTVTVIFTNGWWTNREFEARYGNQTITPVRESVYIGNDYVNRYKLTFTVQQNTQLVIRANYDRDNPVYNNNRYFTIEASTSRELPQAVRYNASTGATSVGKQSGTTSVGKRSGVTSVGKRSGMNLPEGYGVDPDWEELVITLTRADDWKDTVKALPKYDQYGQPYYYAVREVEVPSDYEVSYAPADPVSAEELENTELKVINTFQEPDTGTLVISKTVNGNTANLAKKFLFTVEAVDAEGQPIPTRFYGDVRVENGWAVIEIGHNESKTLEELPEGTVVTITENPDEYSSVRSVEGPVTIVAGETREVAFTNTLNTYQDLIITKEIAGEQIDEEKEFTFTVTLEGCTGDEPFAAILTRDDEQIPETVVFEDAGTEEQPLKQADVTLKHLESIRILGLPNGAKYTVAEKDCGEEYFKPLVDGEESGTVDGRATEPIDLYYTNRKATTVDITATKNWGNFGNSYGATAVRFILKRYSNYEEGLSETVDTVVLTGDEWSVFWEKLKKYEDWDEIHEYNYSVEETGVYFGELTADGKVPEDAVWDEPYMYDQSGGEVTFDEENHGTATLTNIPTEVEVVLEKVWMPLLDDSYTWEASFDLKSDKSEGEILDSITITSSSTIAQKTIARLPRYVKEGDEFKTITYTAEETDFTLWRNGEVVATMGGEEYTTGEPLTVPDEKGDQHISLVNSKNTVKFTVFKTWVDVENPDNMPEVHFTLKYYRVGMDQPQNGQSFVFEDETGKRYDNLPLGPNNDWTWECPVDLPEDDGEGHTYAYFIVENKDSTGKVAFDKSSIPEGMQNSRFIEEDSYISSQGHRTDPVQQINRPDQGYLEGNTGSITVSNRAPGGYMQMDIKKKFVAYRDGSLYTVTGDDAYTNGMVIEVQIYRRAVKDELTHINNYDAVEDIIEVEPWAAYGKSFRLGYDSSGNHVEANSNTYAINYSGNWHWTVEGGNHLKGLPKYGFHFNEATRQYESVKYQYVYLETGAYKDLQGTPLDDGYEWRAVPPAVWEADGQIIMFPQRIAQDQDRMMNLMSTNLRVTKEWIGAPQADKIYVKIFRLDDNNFNAGAIQDYTNLLNKPLVTWEGGTLNNIPDDGDSASVETIDGEQYLVLNAENGWTDLISSVRTSGRSQAFRYWIQEMGYHDASGNHWNETEIAEFEPVYRIVEGTEQVYQNKQTGGPAIVLGPEGTNHLSVTNTSQYGAVQVIKQVPETSGEAAEGKTFTFEITLTPPEGTALVREDMSASGGTIANYAATGNGAVVTITMGGSGTVTLSGIPFGTVYEVIETDVPEGWKLKGTPVYSDTEQTVAKTDSQPDTVTVTNIEITSASVEKIWRKNGKNADWPEEISAITVGLYRSIEDGNPEPVSDEDGNTMTISFGQDSLPTDRIFSELPVYDDEGNPIVYSIREMSIADEQNTADVADDIVILNGVIWQVTASEPDENGKTIITNSRTEIHILKTDMQTGTALAGAEFRLDKHNGITWEVLKNNISVGTEGADTGRATVEIPEDGEYRLSEIKAPSGYIPLGKPAVFTVQNGAIRFENTGFADYDEDTATFTIQNKEGLALPSTGGSGTQSYTVGGMTLIMLAGLALIRRRRKNMQ